MTSRALLSDDSINRLPLTLALAPQATGAFSFHGRGGAGALSGFAVAPPIRRVLHIDEVAQTMGVLGKLFPRRPPEARSLARAYKAVGACCRPSENEAIIKKSRFRC
jgi:hypothetical protein